MRTVILFFALMMSATASFSQCKSWVKQSCRPLLDSYTSHRAINDTHLQPGDETQIMLTFYAHQLYRLVVCHEEQLGDVKFVVNDPEGTLIYDSESAEHNRFDFKVAATQQLIVKVTVPEKDDLVENYSTWGCIAVMTGIKEEM